jgi:tripartite ATP-independent transporter DctM subunit
MRALLVRAASSALPPLVLIAAILASIYFGVATPSEGGAIGAAGALLIAAIKRRLSLRNLKQAMDTTGIICSCILFLVIGSSFFTLIFRGFDGHLWIEGLFAHLPGGAIGFLVVINALIFVLAFFLDFFEIAFIVLPLIMPIAEKMGVNMVWLAVLLATNLQTSFMHPPFGIALFNLRSVAPPQVKTREIYWGAVPFLLIQLAMVALLVAFPGLVTVERNMDNAKASDLELRLPAPSEIEPMDDPPGSVDEAKR